MTRRREVEEQSRRGLTKVAEGRPGEAELRSVLESRTIVAEDLKTEEWAALRLKNPWAALFLGALRIWVVAGCATLFSLSLRAISPGQ